MQSIDLNKDINRETPMSNKNDKPTPTATVKVGTNSNKLPWPQDKSGATQELRRGAVRAIGRIMGSEENLKRVLETLEVAKLYAVERMEEQRKEMTLTKERAEARKEAAAKLASDSLVARVKAKKAEVKKVEAELKNLLK